MIRNKWMKRVVIAVVLFLVFGAISLKVTTDRMEKSAFQLAENGRNIMKTLGACAKAMSVRDTEALMAWYTDDYQSKNQGIWQLKLIEEPSGANVFAWHMPEAGMQSKADLKTNYEQWLTNIKEVDFAKLKLAKIVETNGNQIQARTALWIRGTSQDDQFFESKASFKVQLLYKEQQWFIQSQELIEGTTVTGKGEGFTEVAEAAGVDFRGKHNNTFKTPEWELKRFPIAAYSSAGVSATDYDNDGFYDIFFANGDRSELYRNKGDGTFEKTTDQAGLSDIIGVNVAIFADLDNDGDKDLFMGRFTHENLLFENLGNGTFRKIEDAKLGKNLVAVASAADYDNDGDLDLYLGRYLDARTEMPTTLFYTRNSEGNSLLRNDGNFNFTDVTEEAGVRDGGLTLGTVWGDYDKDGDQDLYIANDFGRNALLRNEGNGKFEDVSKASGTFDLGYGMSASFADVDNDGDLDIYISNVHSSQRWYGQAPVFKNYIITSFKQGTLGQDLPIYREISDYLGADWSKKLNGIIKGNSLLINDGQGNFTDVAEETSANPFGWYWSSTVFDYDNDGFQDIYAANGWITAHNKDDY